jgi:predicted branched-subunit amino acid permease
VDPARWGLDSVGAAVFLGLIAPRLRQRRHIEVAVLAGVVTLAVLPAAPAGLPAIVAAIAVVPFVLGRRRSPP